MKIVDRYIIRQYILTYFFILGLVLAICVMVDFVEKIDDFLDKNPPLTEIVFDYYANFIPYFGNLLTPICIFLAVIFFTSRMAARTEIIPILSTGVSFYRLLAPYLVASLLMGGLSYYLKSFVIPTSTASRLEFEYKYLNKRRVSRSKDIHKKVAEDTYIYMSYFNERNNSGNNFGLERIVDGEIVSKVRAKKISWVDSTQSWRLDRVQIRELRGKREHMRTLNVMDTTFLLTPDDIFIKEQLAESMTYPDLVEFIRLEEMRGSDILNTLYIERHRRFSDPTAVIILTLLGYAMASRKRRGGIALQIGLGMLLCFFYIVLLFAGQVFVGDSYPPWQAVWFPNILFFPLAVWLLIQAPK
ncbi:MAG: LptF/LptG family permease [Bacteroidota bacterium]